MNGKRILITEKSDFRLENKKFDGTESLIIDGIFKKFDNNVGIYTKEEYLEQVKNLQPNINESKLIGEFRYPTMNSVSLMGASHIINSLKYNEHKNQMEGQIKLLNTPEGLVVQDCMRQGLEVKIMSRSIGIIEDNRIKLELLITYDLITYGEVPSRFLTKINKDYGMPNNDNIELFKSNKL